MSRFVSFTDQPTTASLAHTENSQDAEKTEEEQLEEQKWAEARTRLANSGLSAPLQDPNRVSITRTSTSTKVIPGESRQTLYDQLQAKKMSEEERFAEMAVVGNFVKRLDQTEVAHIQQVEQERRDAELKFKIETAEALQTFKR